MLHSCSQFPGNSGCQPRIAASRRKHEGGVIQPKLDPPFRPPAERAIDPNACCFHRGGAAAGYAKKPVVAARRTGKAVVLWRLLAPAQTLGSRARRVRPG